MVTAKLLVSLLASGQLKRFHVVKVSENAPNSKLLILVAQCKMELADPKNGIITCSQAKEYESVCKFYCDQGYTLSMNGDTSIGKLYEQVSCDSFTKYDSLFLIHQGF